jgi:hypothetical protein
MGPPYLRQAQLISAWALITYAERDRALHLTTTHALSASPS